jgi:hypothetical protein
MALYATERQIRDLALHLALYVRRDGDRLVLRERYNNKRKIGTYRTWPAVQRAIKEYMDQAVAAAPKWATAAK